MKLAWPQRHHGCAATASYTYYYTVISRQFGTAAIPYVARSTTGLLSDSYASCYNMDSYQWSPNQMQLSMSLDDDADDSQVPTDDISRRWSKQFHHSVVQRQFCTPTLVRISLMTKLMAHLPAYFPVQRAARDSRYCAQCDRLLAS